MDEYLPKSGASASPAGVPASLQALAPSYLANRRKDVEALHAALAERDFPRVARIGHNLKGTGAPYGFPEIGEIGALLEIAGKQLAESDAVRHIERLSSYLDSVSG